MEPSRPRVVQPVPRPASGYPPGPRMVSFGRFSALICPVNVYTPASSQPSTPAALHAASQELIAAVLSELEVRTP